MGKEANPNIPVEDTEIIAYNAIQDLETAYDLAFNYFICSSDLTDQTVYPLLCVLRA